LDSVLIFIGSGSVVCLMPLAVYLLYLSHLNGRNPPAVIRGDWDFCALLLGLSGFLLLSGPVLLTLADSTYRGVAFGGWGDLKSVGAREARFGSLMAVGYFLVVLGVLWSLIRSRQHLTAVYNVHPAYVRDLLIDVLQQLQYPWREDSGRIAIGLRKLTPETVAGTVTARPAEVATLRIEAFPATHHATLKWGGHFDDLRDEIESAMRNVLPKILPAKNAVPGWFFTAAMVTVIVMSLWIVALCYLILAGH
jgi:hypothetical protein